MGEIMSSEMLIVAFIILIVAFCLNVILFFKVWSMTNNIALLTSWYKHRNKITYEDEGGVMTYRDEDGNEIFQ